MAVTRNFRVVVEELTEEIQRDIVDLLLRIQNKLILATPVRTGWARSNWVSSVAVPMTSTPGVNIRIIDLNWKLVDGPIYLVNNVSYIEKLNAGSSRKAPKNFVDKAIATELREFRRHSRGGSK